MGREKVTCPGQRRCSTRGSSTRLEESCGFTRKRVPKRCGQRFRPLRGERLTSSFVPSIQSLRSHRIVVRSRGNRCRGNCVRVWRKSKVRGTTAACRSGHERTHTLQPRLTHEALLR